MSESAARAAPPATAAGGASRATVAAGAPARGARRRTPLDRRQAIVPQIHQILRERIVSLQWKPRTQLSRIELAAEFGVSQTPVREALLRLEADGLIDVWPQSRTEVAPIDLDNVREVQFLRRALELEVALAVAASVAAQPAAAAREALAPAAALIGQQRAIVEDDGALSRFMALDRAFHRTLFVLAGQDALHTLMTERSADLDRVRRLHAPLQGKRRAIVRDHQAILDAIAGGSEAAVVAAVRSHLSGTAAQLELLIASFPEYF